MTDLIDVVVDFETFYDSDYTLQKLTIAEYILDPRFEIIGASIILNGSPPFWLSGDLAYMKRVFAKIPWHRARFIAHHCFFDGSILEWVLGFQPAEYFCTMMASRPYVVPYTGSMSLRNVGNYLGIGTKGTEVENAKGKRRVDFSGSQLARYGDYCCNDNFMAHEIATRLRGYLPADETRLLDLTVKKFVRPRLLLDRTVIVDRLADLETKRKLIESKAKLLGAAPTTLRSREKFAAVLRSYGVEPETKTSKRTGLSTYAFAKDDEGMVNLLTHSDLRVRTLAEAKIFTSSSMEVKRLERFQSLYDINVHGERRLPVPLLYYGAHTGRFSGYDKINLQNLTRVKRDKSTGDIQAGHLRFALKAPENYSIVAADLSNIEARIVATLARCESMRSGFALKRDLYCEFASRVYGRPITKADEIERFVGKTCIAEGEFVLTDHGLIPIEKVRLEHRVWDGTEWVRHDGVIYQGEREVITYDGLTATEDHEVVLEDGRTVQFGEAASKMDRLAKTGFGGKEIRIDRSPEHYSQAAERVSNGVMSLQWQWDNAMDELRQFAKQQDDFVLSQRQTSDVTRGNIGQKIRRYSQSLYQKARSSVHALWGAWYKSLLHFSKVIYSLGQQKSSASRLPWGRDRSDRQQRELWAWKSAAGHAVRTGSEQAPHSSNSISWQNDPISGVRESLQLHMDVQAGKARYVGGRYKRKVRVYDLVNAGPRHRFTVSNCLVLNCILGLGYGMGWMKFLMQMKIARVKMSDQMGKHIVYLYRDTYREVPALWAQLEYLVQTYCIPKTGLHCWGPLTFMHERIILPNGMPIIYPGLHYSQSTGKLVFNAMRGKSRVATPTSLWGGTICENVTQALAKIIISAAELKLSQHNLHAVLQVHDELVYCVRTEHVTKTLKAIDAVLCRQVPWLPKLPVACEIKSGPTYGDAK